MQTLIIIIFIVLAGAALVSMVETAVFSMSLSKARILVEKRRKGSTALLKVKENMSGPITVIAILANAFSIVGSIIIGAMTSQVLGNAWLGVVSAILTFLIIIFGEIIPKSIGENYAEQISLIATKPLLSLVRIFSPIIWVIEKVTDVFAVSRKTVSEEEIRILSNLGHMEGSIESDEREMIQKVFMLNDLSARDIMTPRTVMVALNGNKTIGELENEIYSLSHSRLPVYSKNLDNIIGICHQRNLLIALAKGEKSKKITDLRQEAIFVPENMKADIMLPFFQKQRCHLAVVVDEFGGTSGVVTLEDVLEQLVGEIVDEKDMEVDLRDRAKNIKKEIFKS